MKINIKTIGKQKFDLAKGIFSSRSLPDHRKAAFISGDLHILACEVIWFSIDVRQNLILYNTWRDIPIGTKYHLVQVTIKHHRIVSFLTDHYNYIKCFLFPVI